MLIGCWRVGSCRQRPTSRSSTRPTTPSRARRPKRPAKILDTNKEILTTVEETLKAVTGDRGGDAGSLKDLAIGNGFSVSSCLPSTAA